MAIGTMVVMIEGITAASLAMLVLMPLGVDPVLNPTVHACNAVAGLLLINYFYGTKGYLRGHQHAQTECEN